VDDADEDVTYVVQELRAAGVEVRLDREVLVPGRRLWNQIGDEIEDPKCDGWIVFATRAAFESEAVMEELAYAIQRAITARGEAFPLIALLADAPVAELPVGLRIRLGVPLADSSWVDRVVSGLRGEAPAIQSPHVGSYALTVHEPNAGHTDQWCVKVRPRAGTWSPSLFVAIPEEERDLLGIALCGPKNLPNGTGMVLSGQPQTSPDGRWYGIGLTDEATPTRSLYTFFSRLPSRLRFGINGGPSWTVEF
jgi:hypothetical protein